ncbi:MAG TPA: hypothetical protein VIL09_14740 [Microvirga sp.]|jgi:hypothetical protein
MRRTLLIGLAGLGALCAPALAAPERRVLAMDFAKADLQVLANQVASTARRCWLARGPAFETFRVERIEPGRQPASYQVVFSDRTATRMQPGRHLRLIVAHDKASTVIVAEQEGVDIRDAIGRDAETLIKGRVVTC